MKRSLWLMLLMTTLAGCSSAPESTISRSDLKTYYDYQLFDAQGTPLDQEQWPLQVANYDVILVGEWHTHAGIHRFQTDLLRQLLTSAQPLALSMEQFNRDSQSHLDDYLSGQIGEQILTQRAKAWPNYDSDYRPLIELAKASHTPVIAANAPKDIVQCIGREGIGYLDRLPQSEREYVARQVDTSDSEYKRTFMGSMHHGESDSTERHFAAQVTWDETMAESITDYIADHPGAKVLHIAGKFHVQQGEGIKASILRRNPALKVLTITPVDEIDSNGTDYQLQVLAPPALYVQEANRKQAFEQLSHRNAELNCIENPAATQPK
ncbi:ChaN family lipoprotein [Vibrio sp.]|uniref:ChaN family lipoprotein n=1 Tax=Vibrio sp. TaxID=678 RepID=UPI003D13C51C